MAAEESRNNAEDVTANQMNARRPRNRKYGASSAGKTLSAVASPAIAPAAPRRPRASDRHASATSSASKIDHCPFSRLYRVGGQTSSPTKIAATIGPDGPPREVLTFPAPAATSASKRPG